MRKHLRNGKVFVDRSRNNNKRTTVCVCSLRAKEHPAVSTPLQWKVAAGALRKQVRPTFDSKAVPALVKKYGDLFAPFQTLQQ